MHPYNVIRERLAELAHDFEAEGRASNAAGVRTALGIVEDLEELHAMELDALRSTVRADHQSERPAHDMRHRVAQMMDRAQMASIAASCGWCGLVNDHAPTCRIR
jgi:hypothetical protein